MGRFNPITSPSILACAAAGALSSILASAALPAAAAAVGGESIWLAPSASAPMGAKWPLRIEIAPAETQCRAAYGNDWFEKCMLTLGKPGTRAEGVQLSPNIPGDWRWESPRTLAFTPKDAWQPGKRLRVSLFGLPMPLRATMTTSALTVETPPLASTGAHGSVWIDPVDPKNRALSFELSLTTAASAQTKAQIEKNFTVEFDAKSGLKLGRPAFVWSEDSTNLYVKVPVIALAADPVVASAKVKGVAGRTTAKDGRFSVPKGFEAAQVSVTVPGQSTVFQISEASVSPVKDDGLNAEYEATVAATLAVDPARLADSITALVLPKKMNASAASDTVWTDAPVIDDEALKNAAKIEIRPDLESSTATRVKLRFKAAPGDFVYLALPKGFVQSSAGESPKLAEDWHAVLALPTPSAEIAFLQPGSMLTLSGAWELSLFTTGIEKLKWRIARVRDDFLSLAADGWNVMERTAPDSWVSAVSGETELGAVDAKTPGAARFTSLDLSDAVMAEGAGLYQIELAGVRTKDGKEETVVRTAKRLLITNIAMIAKTSADGALDVFAASFATGLPAEGLKAMLLAENGTVLEEIQTDAQGRAHFKNTRGWEREKKPAAVAVRSGGTDLAWLSLKDYANKAETYRWDVGGRHTGGTGLSAFSFADRGIYRAGETVHFGFGVRKLDFEKLPEGTPIEMKLTSDAGRVIESRSVKLSEAGLAEFDWQIPEGTLPGTVRLDLFAGGKDKTALSTTSVYVGDFEPETLSLAAKLPSDESEAGWLLPKDLPVAVTLTSLFGAGAEGRRVTGTARVTPLMETKLPGWDGWTFPSPGAAPWKPLANDRTLDLESAATPGTGTAEMTVPLSLLNSSGFAEVDLALTGTESEGAAAVEKHLTFLTAPKDVAVGWRIEKTPQPSWFLLTGEPAGMSFAAVGRDLKPRAGERLKVSIEKTRWVTTLTEDASGRFTYLDAASSELRRTMELTTGDDGTASIDLMTGEPGSWIVKVADASGEEILAATYSTAGGRLADFADGSLPAAELRAKLEKTELSAGETARASVLSPISGFALATFESADVISAHWVKVNAGENLIELPVPESFTGRAWLRISVVRGQEDAKKFLKGFAEAAVPVTINAGAKTLGLKIEAPEKVADARTIPVSVSSDKPSEVFLFAADEGILSLTGWQTPNPVKTMLLDRALEVDTRETLSLLMPDAGALKDLIKSPTGGDFMESAKAAAGFASPFKRTLGPSAVWWGGKVEVGPDAKTFEVKLPEGFAGRVRVVAVGAADAQAGAASVPVTAAPPLAISPAMPTTLSPGDQFRAGAVVTPDFKANAGELSIAFPDVFGTDPQRLALDFPEAGGRSASAEFKVPDGIAALGEHKVVFTAAVGEETPEGAEPVVRTAERSESIVVRPASLYTERLYTGRTENSEGKSAFEVPVELYPQGAHTRFVAASSPAALAPELGRPFQAKTVDFGAVLPRIAASLPELLLSLNPDAQALLPQSALSSSPEAAEKAAADAADRRAKVYAAVKANLAWQGLRGAPWGEADPFIGALALDYLADAARVDPAALEPLAMLKSRLARSVNLDPQTLDEARTSAYALWALTREGTMTTAQLESLRASMASRFENWNRDAAAAFIAAAYSRLKLRDEAQAVLGASISTARASGGWSPETASALALSALSDAGLGTTSAAKLLATISGEDLARAFASGFASPAYAAAAARAALSPEVGGLASTADAAAAPDLVCTKRSEGFPADQDRLVLGAWGALLDAPGCLAAETSGMPDSPYVWWQAAQEGYVVPHDGVKPARTALDIERTFLGADGKAKTKFLAGERVTVQVKLKSFAGDAPLKDVVLTDLLPGGFSWAMPAGACPEGALECRRADDRIQWAAPELTNWDPLTFTYTVRAAYPGIYAAGAPSAQSISNPQLRAEGAAVKVTIASTEPQTPKASAAPKAEASAKTSSTEKKTSEAPQAAQTKPAAVEPAESSEAPKPAQAPAEAVKAAEPIEQAEPAAAPLNPQPQSAAESPAAAAEPAPADAS